MESEDTAIRLMLGYLCVSKEAEASLPRKVQILDRFDLTVSEISKICACSSQSVANARQSLKKGRHAKKKKAKKKK